ncbi:DUF4595 domain-containing protein [uncultured Alistipes sp.]|uniref:BACON domain-containing protein n=1 Tax=uncultured Alistipes sp. TaxID=538949 RepID=UPI0026327E70|nr:DUF4595 domain-containing protein [uncultured Alistipes sp.]
MKKCCTILLTLAASLLAACSNDAGGGDKNAIRLTPGTQTGYKLYADETSLSANISFTTEGAWRATVSETRAGCDWITVTPDHGDADGDYTVSITLAVNTSGTDRQATVTFESGGTKVRITVEQQATTAEGEIPGGGEAPSGARLISTITGHPEGNSSGASFTYSATYDSSNRITKWTQQVGSEERTTATFEYNGNTVTVQVLWEDLAYSESSTKSYKAYLDDNGRVIRTERSGSTTTYSYDAEGQLIRIEQPGEWQENIWEDGNLVKTLYSEDGGAEATHIFRYTYHKTLANRENFDLGYYRYTWDEELGITGLLGTPCRNLLYQERGDSEWAGKDDFDLTYEVDDEGYVVSCTETRDGNWTRYEYTHIPAAK